MKGHIALLVVLLYAVSTFAEPEAEADPRVKQQAVQPIEVPIAQTEDNKFYVLFGRNGKPENPADVATLRKDGQFEISEDDDVQLQSFVPVHDDQYGTLLIPSNALDKVAEDEIDELDDTEGLGRARGRRRMRRRRRRMRRRNRRTRRRFRRRRHRQRRRRHRHRRRFRRNRRRTRGRRRRRHHRRRRRTRRHRRRHRSRSRRRQRRARRRYRRRKEEEDKRKQEEDYDY